MKTYFKNISAEFRKISWPTKKELKKDLCIFLIVFIVLVAIISLIDSSSNWVVMKILSLF